MPLFSYKKTQHRRKLNPGPFKSYKTYKKYLKKEFDEKCVYCLIPDVLKEESFCVEHYWPREYFKHLELDYSNLYYACLMCNSYKGSFWPTEDNLKLGNYLPNPCDHVMYDHLRFRGAKISPHSRTGKFSEELLHLNDQKFINYREMVLAMRDGLKLRINEYRNTVQLIQDKIESSDDDIKESLNDNLISYTTKLNELEDILFRIER